MERFGEPAAALIPGQNQQLGVEQEQFGGGFFEAAAGRDPRADRLNPVGGNVLDALLASGHEGEGPDWMTVAAGAMTGGLSTAAMGEGERSG